MKSFWQRRGPTDSESRKAAGPDYDDSVYPPELERRERKAIEDRRAAAGLEKGDPQVPIGLACSGGGIRSATLCVGVFQALARSDFLRRIDFLSTVSGGGYAGAFLEHLYLRSYVNPKEDQPGQAASVGSEGAVRGATSAERVSGILSDSHSKPVAFLRENGRHPLREGGDFLLTAAIVLRNWLAVQFVLLTFCAAGLFGFLLLRTLVAAAVGAIFGRHPPGVETASFIAVLSRFDPSTAHSIWISDYFLLAAILAVVLAVPAGMAYWLTRPGDLIVAAALGLVAVAFLLSARGLDAFLFAVASYWLMAAVFCVISAQEGWSAPTEQSRWKRGDRLSHLLRQGLKAAGVVAAVAFIDSLGQTLHARPNVLIIASAPTVLAALLPLGKRLVPLASYFIRGGRPKASVNILAGLVSVFLGLGLLAMLSGLTYELSDVMSSRTAEHQGWIAFWSRRLGAASAGFLGFGLLSLIIGHTLSFLNRSSLQTLYASRVTRAYMGASNPENLLAAGRGVDAMSWEDYHPEKFGGPLHLINTTINETAAAGTHVVQRDRRGVGLAVGPFGLSVGVRHHALWTRSADAATGHLSRRRTLMPLSPASGFRVFATEGAGDVIEVEPLTLGDWVSISGAAATTGIGYSTSLWMRFLAGLANMRLGYWWNSGVDPASRVFQTPPGMLQRLARRLPLFLVQRLLLSELLTRFQGTALTWWYLSDGGHFENTGAYELIRRRVPLIIVLDNGADPNYLLEDLGNLVRKARIDFQTTIRFAGEGHDTGVTQVAKAFEGTVGTPAQLKPSAPAGTARSSGPSRAARRIAAAAIDYPDGQRGLLLLVKPTLLGDEPFDVLQYAANHPRFPQEPAADQFFDEAQWESYRMLGEHIGGKLAALLESLRSTGASSIGDAVIGRSPEERA